MDCPIIKLSVVVLIFVGLASCGESGETREDETLYKSAPEDLLNTLRTECDYIDIVFFNSPLSMNQQEPRAIASTIGYIASSPATPSDSCTSLGRITFVGDGQILAEADAYHQPNCAYFLFYENEEPVYCSAMRESGVQFFKNLLPYINVPQ